MIAIRELSVGKRISHNFLKHLRPFIDRGCLKKRIQDRMHPHWWLQSDQLRSSFHLLINMLLHMLVLALIGCPFIFVVLFCWRIIYLSWSRPLLIRIMKLRVSEQRITVKWVLLDVHQKSYTQSKTDCLLYFFLHLVQWNGLSRVWVRSWRDRCSVFLKSFPQKRQRRSIISSIPHGSQVSWVSWVLEILDGRNP